ncbi:MAG: hypothetical protein NXI22_02510 [bacterium]|nr:hypothetical protein [bacterium]
MNLAARVWRCFVIVDGGFVVVVVKRDSTASEGHDSLVRDTGADFAYDLQLWREYLLENEKHGYSHPYAFEAVDAEVRRAIADAEFLRHVEMATDPDT